MSDKFLNDFKEAYTKIYEMHPNEPDNPKLQYVNRGWFFPNHLNLVIQNSKVFHNKYFPKSEIQVVLFAALFHDTGLVYMRESEAPTGHEDRSLEYAENQLKVLKYDSDFIKKVKHAIESTEPEVKPESDEATIVRTADAYSHFSSIHFFAKSNYSPSFEGFLGWFSRKIESTYEKLAIQEVKKEVEPTYEWYKRAIKIYDKQKDLDLFEVITE